MIARPILMSAPMVRALLASSKTQTRRAVKPQPECGFIVGGPGSPACPYGQPGDVLWCRETFAQVGNVDPPWTLYRASGYESECKRHRFTNPPPESEQKWRPAIFMPRALSRLTLRITEVRVQRLQEISERDVLAEGCAVDRVAREYNVPWSLMPTLDHAYRVVWEAINGAGAWDANPFVWCISFEVHQRNVEQFLPATGKHKEQA